jgi:hypothetical protein
VLKNLLRRAVRVCGYEIRKVLPLPAGRDWPTRFDDIRALLVPHGFCLHGIYDCVQWGVHLKYANALPLHEADFPVMPNTSSRL